VKKSRQFMLRLLLRIWLQWF